MAGPSAFSGFRDAPSACHSHASLTDEAEGQSGDARIDRTGEPFRSSWRQADLHLYVCGEYDVVSCGAILKQITHGASIHQSDDAPDQRNAVCGDTIPEISNSSIFLHYYQSINDPNNALLAISIADEQSLASGQIQNLCAVNPAPVLTVKIKSPTSEHRQFSISDIFYPVHIPRPEKILLKQRCYHGPS